MPASLAFAETKVGKTVVKDLTIKNTADFDVLTVTKITLPAGFTADWQSDEIAVGSEKTVKVSFKPTEVKAYAGTVIIASDAANSGIGKSTLSVSGKGMLVTGITAKGGTSEPQTVFPGLSVFPNPAEDLLNVKLPNQTRPVALQLVDVNGQVVYEQEAVTTNELSLDLSGYKSGVYVLVLESGSKAVKQKVVIK